MRRNFLMCHLAKSTREKKERQRWSNEGNEFRWRSDSGDKPPFSRATYAPRKKKINRSKVSPKVTPFVFRHSGTDGLVYLWWKIHSDRCYRHRARHVRRRSILDRGSRRVRALRNRVTRLSFSLSLSLSLSEIVTVTLTTRQQRGLLVISTKPAPIPPLINYYHRFTRTRDTYAQYP